MADLRLIALAIGALAGCGRAGAEASPEDAVASGLTPPAGWQTLPEIATAARDAIGRGTTVEGVEAWGETAMGCYALWLAVRGTGDAEAVAREVLAGITPRPGHSTDPVTLEVRDVAKPTGAEGELSLGFERAPYRGRLRARLGGGRIVALACFANQREPIACESACTRVLGGMP